MTTPLAPALRDLAALLTRSALRPGHPALLALGRAARALAATGDPEPLLPPAVAPLAEAAAALADDPDPSTALAALPEGRLEHLLRTHTPLDETARPWLEPLLRRRADATAPLVERLVDGTADAALVAPLVAHLVAELPARPPAGRASVLRALTSLASLAPWPSEPLARLDALLLMVSRTRSDRDVTALWIARLTHQPGVTPPAAVVERLEATRRGLPPAALATLVTLPDLAEATRDALLDRLVRDTLGPRIAADRRATPMQVFALSAVLGTLAPPHLERALAAVDREDPDPVTALGLATALVRPLTAPALEVLLQWAERHALHLDLLIPMAAPAALAGLPAARLARLLATAPRETRELILRHSARGPAGA